MAALCLHWVCCAQAGDYGASVARSGTTAAASPGRASVTRYHRQRTKARRDAAPHGHGLAQHAAAVGVRLDLAADLNLRETSQPRAVIDYVRVI
jgi:hypothetical protein